jgi:tetratricopeptide (TPR) repeat protein
MNLKSLTIIILTLFIVLTAKEIAGIEKGELLFKNGKFEEAIEHFEKLEKKVKDSSDLYLWIAKSYLSNINNVSFLPKQHILQEFRIILN